MKNVLVLSDTHSYIDERILYYCHQADEIWHAGDIGSKSVLEKIHKPIKAVYGNIDGKEIREKFPCDLRFFFEGIDVFITHIARTNIKAGAFNTYIPRIEALFKKNPPSLFIYGHSHILQIGFDKKHAFYFINPGAAGLYGGHAKRTLVRFKIHKKKIFDMQVIDLGEKSKR